jgi:hypothetical protein
MQAFMELGRQARDKVKFSFRYPVPAVTVVARNSQVSADLKSLEGDLSSYPSFSIYLRRRRIRHYDHIVIPVLERTSQFILLRSLCSLSDETIL